MKLKKISVYAFIFILISCAKPDLVTSDNKKILDQVKNAVSSKKSNEKKLKTNNNFDNISNAKKKIIDNWIKNNAEIITKEIISEYVKKLFK